MTPELIHSIWKLIEVLPTKRLLNQDSDVFVNLLIKRLLSNEGLKSEQVKVAKAYIASRMPLIRELTERGQFALHPYLTA